VVSSFKTGDEGNYNVDNVLRSLGELEKIGESKKHNSNNNASSNSNSGSTNGNKTSNGNNNNGSSNSKLPNGKHVVNGNGKTRRKSNDKGADVDDKKLTSDDEASTDASSNYSSAAELNHLPDTFTAKNVVLIDEADLKRQTSRCDLIFSLTISEAGF